MKSFGSPRCNSRGFASSWWWAAIVEEGVGNLTEDLSGPPIRRARWIARTMSRNHDCITGIIPEAARLGPPECTSASTLASESSRPLRLLVVEDNRDTADSLGILLGYWGTDVRVCRSGVEALAAALAYRPDAALIDVVMPGLSGYQLARDLRKHQGLEHVLLIAMTGLGDPDNRRLAQEAGFAHHLLKPCVHQQLREILTTLPRKGAGC
jgi:CheY-like chemotaxis protein